MIIDYERCKGSFIVEYLDNNEKVYRTINVDEKSINGNCKLAKGVIDNNENDVFEIKQDNIKNILKVKLISKEIDIYEFVPEEENHNNFGTNIQEVDVLSYGDIYFKFDYIKEEKYEEDTYTADILKIFKQNRNIEYKEKYCRMEKIFLKQVVKKCQCNNMIICMVPGHIAKNSNEGNSLSKIIEHVSNISGNIDGTNLLIRNKTIVPQKMVLWRDVETHFNSVIVNEIFDIKEKTILLIDDITTSGCSLRACKEILLSEGAKRVISFAFGRTKR